MPAPTLLLSLLLACAGVGPSAQPVPPAAAPAPPPEAPAIDCASLDAEACEAAPGCSPIFGLKAAVALALNNNEPPPETPTPEFFACGSAEVGCKEVETWASAGAGQPCYVFGDSCTPPGWVPCKP
ncbi:MAG: hypothetical protein ABIO70_35785 [Pseudomonadota bacterium]